MDTNRFQKASIDGQDIIDDVPCPTSREVSKSGCPHPSPAALPTLVDLAIHSLQTTLTLSCLLLRQTFPDKVRVEPGLGLPCLCCSDSFRRRVQVGVLFVVLLPLCPKAGTSKAGLGHQQHRQAKQQQAGEVKEPTRHPDSLLPGLSWTRLGIAGTKEVGG